MEERAARPWDLINPHIGRVPIEIATERFSICKSCPQYIKSTTQCKECGCIMKLKTKLPNASCPIGKWHQIENGE